MKKTSIIQKLASGKGFYVTVAVSLCLIVAAVVTVYRTSTNMIKDLVTVPDEVTEQARQNETDEADPRYEIPFYTNPTLPDLSVPETSVRWDNTDEVATTVPPTEAPISNESYILPLGSEILRDFSPKIPTYDVTMGDWRTHQGIDFYAEAGTEVKAVGNGKVVRVMSDKSFGFTVEIDHGDFIARYCGLSQEKALKLGDRVSVGDTVGTVATVPCEAAEESHLHFEVVIDGAIAEPLEAMKKTP